MSTTNNHSILQINTAALRGTREAHQPDEIKPTTRRTEMTTFVLDPTATPDAVSDIDIRLILEVEAGKKPHLSTSQMIMVGLALCKPNMLKNAHYQNPRDAWSRLDDCQRKAITDFRLFNLKEGESK